LGRLWVRKKWRFGEYKAAISLKRVKIEKVTIWTAYRNSSTLFRTVLPPTPYGLPFLQIGGLQVSYPLLSQEQVKLGPIYGLKFGGYIYRANPNKCPLKILETRERGRIQGLPNFLGTPYYPRNG